MSIAGWQWRNLECGMAYICSSDGELQEDVGVFMFPLITV